MIHLIVLVVVVVLESYVRINGIEDNRGKDQRELNQGSKTLSTR